MALSALDHPPTIYRRAGASCLDFGRTPLRTRGLGDDWKHPKKTPENDNSIPSINPWRNFLACAYRLIFQLLASAYRVP
jgi:hypothetical protein